METFFKEALEYTRHFNERILESLSSPGISIPEKSFILLNHIINAQEIWNARIEQKPIGINVWGTRPLENLSNINNTNHIVSMEIISKCDFEKVITYTNTKGETFKNSIRDIMFHMINHSTYHRGQIATDYKHNNITPLITDYIFFKRESL